MHSNDISIFYYDDQKVNNTIVKEILDYAISSDPWIAQIYKLSLPKSAKEIVMNSWKENISSNKIYLNIRNKYRYLYSEKLNNMICMKCRDIFGISMKLRIEENNNFSKKTPMELISFLYKKKVLQLKKKFLIDPDIILIQSFFDIEFNEEDINIF